MRSPLWCTRIDKYVIIIAIETSSKNSHLVRLAAHLSPTLRGGADEVEQTLCKGSEFRVIEGHSCKIGNASFWG